MSDAREQATATVLTDGDVLVAGGLNEGGDSGFPGTYSSAELYNPSLRPMVERATASINVARAGQTATRLNGGWVPGGHWRPGRAQRDLRARADVWVQTGRLSTVRTDQTSTLLGDGDVLVAGGAGPGSEPGLGRGLRHWSRAASVSRRRTHSPSPPKQWGRPGTRCRSPSPTTGRGRWAWRCRSLRCRSLGLRRHLGLRGRTGGPRATAVRVLVRFSPLYRACGRPPSRRGRQRHPEPRRPSPSAATAARPRV